MEMVDVHFVKVCVIALLWDFEQVQITIKRLVMNCSADFQLLSSMRYDESRPWELLLTVPQHENVDADSPILLLSYHRARLMDACDAFGWTKAATKLRENNSCELILSLAQGAIEKERARDNKHTDDGHAYKVKAFGFFSSADLPQIPTSIHRFGLSCIAMGDWRCRWPQFPHASSISLLPPPWRLQGFRVGSPRFPWSIPLQ